jgi:DNA-binding GntR family transcriptional regulator
MFFIREAMHLITDSFADILPVERFSLKDQATALLRDLIVSGRIAPGSKITERDVADLLSISRMPARDALMDLERQGLIVTRPGGRYVIELKEIDIRRLYQLRLALEKLAIELTISALNAEDLATLTQKLNEMRAAIAASDIPAYTASDLEFHKIIWQLADNPYLLNMLNSMIGPIFMFIASQASIVEDWQASLQLHEQMLAMIAAKNIPGALESMEAHTRHSLDLCLKEFKR